MKEKNLRLAPDEIERNVREFTQKIFQALRSEKLEIRFNHLADSLFTVNLDGAVTFTAAAFFIVIEECEINIDTMGFVLVPYVQAVDRGLYSAGSLIYPVTIQRGIKRDYISLHIPSIFLEDMSLLAQVIIKKHYSTS